MGNWLIQLQTRPFAVKCLQYSHNYWFKAELFDRINAFLSSLNEQLELQWCSRVSKFCELLHFFIGISSQIREILASNFNWPLSKHEESSARTLSSFISHHHLPIVSAFATNDAQMMSCRCSFQHWVELIMLMTWKSRCYSSDELLSPTCAWDAANSNINYANSSWRFIDKIIWHEIYGSCSKEWPERDTIIINIFAIHNIHVHVHVHSVQLFALNSAESSEK